MAPQNESDPKPRDEKTKVDDTETSVGSSRSVSVESAKQRIEPFSDDDTQYSARARALVSETAGLLDQVHAQPAGFNGATPEQLANLYKDANERALWNQARQDGFLSILRLGLPTPPRSKRIL